MTELISQLGAIWTFFFDKFTDILGLFTTEPILVFLFGIMVTGAVIGLAMRPMHRR